MKFPPHWRKFMLLSCALFLQHIGLAQTHSNTGKEFWTGYGHHQFMEPGMGNSQEMILYLSTGDQPARVKLSLHGTTLVRNYTIPANSSLATEPIPKTGIFDARLYSVPPNLGGTGGEGLFQNKGIHIESDVPIVANAHILGSASSGAAMLMPVETWGYSYTSMNSMQYYQGNCFSWLFVVAKEDNTKVEIIPSAPTRNGRLAGVPFTVTLHKGQIFQLVGAYLSGGYTHDLTGSKIRSVANESGNCFPVGVFSGSSRTYIACAGGNPAGGDNIIQQAFPEQAWGQRYLTTPFSTSISASGFQTGIYRVLVKDPATVVKKNGVTLSSLINNAYYEFESNTADYIEADQPVMVAQYMASTGGCANTGPLGDVEMIYLSAVDQGIKKTTLARTDRESISYNYVSLVVPTAGLASLQIDGSNTFSHVYAHPANPAYTVVVRRWDAAVAASTITCDVPFTGITYGLGSVESYGYNMGTNLLNLNGKGIIRNDASNTGTENSYTCAGTPVHLSVLLPYQPAKLVWQVSSAAGAVAPDADVTQNAPVAAGTQVVNGKTHYLYTLPQTYIFKNAGTYDIPVISTNTAAGNCSHQETINVAVEVKPAPVAVSSLTHPTACTLDTVYLAGPETDAGYNFDRWKWSFGDGSTAADRETKKIFAPGAHEATLEAISTEGCIARDKQAFTVHARPTAAFTASAPGVCENGAITFTDNGSAYAGSAAITTYEWNFGNGPSVIVPDNQPQQATYAAYGRYGVTLVTKVSELCISDTALVTVKGYAKPAITLTVPDKCLPANGSTAFTSSAALPDSQHIAQHAWDFGDGSPVSADKDPTHTYTKDGTYPVTYTATTNEGCTADTLVNVALRLKPELAYAAVPPLCENAAAASIATATVLNGATGAGVYSGPGIDDAGNLQPSLAGPGAHNARYIFTTAAGCVDSVSAAFTVNAKPSLQLTVPSGCLPVSGQSAFSGAATTPDGQGIAAYSWNFGDGTPVSAEQNPVHAYTKPGSYNILYTATTANGCKADTTVSTTLGIAPQLAYSTVPPVCVSAPGPVSAANATVLNNMTGTGVYAGTGITAAGSFTPAAIGTGTHAVKYIFTTTAGCKDSISNTVTVLPAPVASFIAAADSVCVGAELAFTDMSTGGVSSWDWNFGNGATAAVANPAQRFNNAGRFEVSLRVTDGAGCVSDAFRLPVIAVAPPVIDAGPSFTVPEGVLVQFKPQTADSTRLSFSWAPAGDFIDPQSFSASLVARRDAVYTLTATAVKNCAASDEVTVKILRAIKPPNVFSPNGDNINDTWIIPGITYYPDCIVEVFSRHGERLYRSAGYGVSWNGTVNGSVLPVGTYYYVIRLKPGDKPVTGSITILK